jgi:hypothetical protein
MRFADRWLIATQHACCLAVVEIATLGLHAVSQLLRSRPWVSRHCCFKQLLLHEDDGSKRHEHPTSAAKSTAPTTSRVMALLGAVTMPMVNCAVLLQAPLEPALEERLKAVVARTGVHGCLRVASV